MSESDNIKLYQAIEKICIKTGINIDEILSENISLIEGLPAQLPRTGKTDILGIR